MVDTNFVLLCFNMLNFLDYVMVIWQKSIIKNEKISGLYVDRAKFVLRTYLSFNKALAWGYFSFLLI